jgi:hypothetical protein
MAETLFVTDGVNKMAGNVDYAREAPISKHQNPNNIQIPISNDPYEFVSKFGRWVIGNYLEFRVWILGFEHLFYSGYAGLGRHYGSVKS